MTIEDFGARVASVWDGMRPTTRRLIVGALEKSGEKSGDKSGQKSNLVSQANAPHSRGVTDYDARSDWELSRLLAALDERRAEQGLGLGLSDAQANELIRMADTCAAVLQSQTQSAEVFAHLVERALGTNDYARVDALGEILTLRFSASEICELARNNNPVVRALAQEALALVPTVVLADLLSDPVDMEIARDALERQAFEYENETARQIVLGLDQADLAAEEEDED